MEAIRGEKIFYGIENINEKLDSIIGALNLKKYTFEIKLIISEAMTNAFIHGNDSDSSKPINIQWKIDKNDLFIQVTDCGLNHNDNFIDINNGRDTMAESGRGLFIISAYSDDVKFKDNTIIMRKSLE